MKTISQLGSLTVLLALATAGCSKNATEPSNAETKPPVTAAAAAQTSPEVVPAHAMAKTETGAKAPKAFDAKPAVGTKGTCPVMGNEYAVSENTLFSEYKGKTYGFCCPGCKPKFDQDPTKYVGD